MNASLSRLVDKRDRDRFVALSFCWGDLLFELDGRAQINFCAGPFEAFTGCLTETLPGRPFLDMVVPEDAPLVMQMLKIARHRGRADHTVIHLKRITDNTKTAVPVELSGYYFEERWYLALRLCGSRTLAAKATARPRSDEGLLDHDRFAKQASQQIHELAADGRKVGMTVVAIDGLEDLRETLSPDRSQALMASIGACLGASSIDGASATRLGSDTYGLLCDDSFETTLLDDQLARTLRSVAPAEPPPTIKRTTMDLGRLTTVNQEDLAKGLIYALSSFQRKAGETVDINTLSDNLTRLISQGVTEIGTFREIISSGRFSVAVQPIIGITNGAVHHFEALCRFADANPESSPYRYITFAEETGLIHEFDLAMVTTVVRWLKKLPVNNSKYAFAVNISGYSIGMPSYVDGLHDLLVNNSWTQGRLLFEITESARMTDLDAANDFIQGLRRLGYKVCLDDFGAGAASFQYLSALEVDVVKIDGSAVRNAARAPKGRAFLSALTELCTRLGVETIAEMVDSPETLRFCRDCGCDYVQGFLFGKPSRKLGDFSPLPNSGLFR